MLVANLKNGMTITNADLVSLMSELKIKIYTLIDAENLADFRMLTGFTASHNYNDCQTYNIAKW